MQFKISVFDENLEGAWVLVVRILAIYLLTREVIITSQQL